MSACKCSAQPDPPIFVQLPKKVQRSAFGFQTVRKRAGALATTSRIMLPPYRERRSPSVSLEGRSHTVRRYFAIGGRSRAALYLLLERQHRTRHSSGRKLTASSEPAI